LDRKTLEYLEERAKKARGIVMKIESLLENVENINKIKVVRFLNHNWNSQFDSSTGNLTELVKVAYVKLATEEIQRLEQELAEL